MKLKKSKSPKDFQENIKTEEKKGKSKKKSIGVAYREAGEAKKRDKKAKKK